MQMEHYPDHGAFCRTDSYQQWLETWRVPRAAVDLWVDSEQDIWGHHTPRHQLTQRWSTRLPFYLLDSLRIGTEACVDIGCGHNWFRQFYPSIRGVDPHNEHHRDEPLTADWYTQNRGRWPRAFSCNSLHFADQRAIAGNILEARGTLAPAGRAMITLNRARIEERTQDYSAARLREDLLTLPGLTRMVWLDQPRNCYMEGNVWLWLAA